MLLTHENVCNFFPWPYVNDPVFEEYLYNVVKMRRFHLQKVNKSIPGYYIRYW